MKKNYEISGMSCGGCVNSVKNALLKLPEIQEAEVGLNSQRAILTMDKTIDVAELQTQLSNAGHYAIKELGKN